MREIWAKVSGPLVIFSDFNEILAKPEKLGVLLGGGKWMSSEMLLMDASCRILVYEGTLSLGQEVNFGKNWTVF